MKMAILQKFINNVLRFEKRLKSLAVVPKSLGDKVLKMSHCHLAAGYFGVNEIFRRILDCGWWPVVRKDEEDYVGNFQICCVRNRKIEITVDLVTEIFQLDRWK